MMFVCGLLGWLILVCLLATFDLGLMEMFAYMVVCFKFEWVICLVGLVVCWVLVLVSSAITCLCFINVYFNLRLIVFLCVIAVYVGGLYVLFVWWRSF